MIVRGRHAFVILNLYPYNSGHLMVVPRRHLDSLGLATADELQEIMALLQLGVLLDRNEVHRAHAVQALAQGVDLGLHGGPPPSADAVARERVLAR